MATYAKVLLSGATYGSHEDIALDATYTTVHQTSTTSGAIEDVTVVLYNSGSSDVGVTISIEQDGTAIKTYTDSVPANDSKAVISQVTLAENIDVKIKQTESGVSVFSASNLITGNSNDIYTADLDGSNSSSQIDNIGHESAFAVDPVNGYLFKGEGSYSINVYSLSTGALLQEWTVSDLTSTCHIPNSRITAVPAVKKLVVNYVEGATMVIDYADIAAPSPVTVTYSGNAIKHAGANLYGVFGQYSTNGNLHFFTWGNLTSPAYSASVSYLNNMLNAYGGVIRGDVNGSGFAAFGGQNQVATAHGTWDGASSPSVLAVPEYYVADCVFDGNGNVIYIPSTVSSSYRIKKYALTTNSYSAQASSYSDDYTKTIKTKRGQMSPINDGSDDVLIFHNKNNTASKVVLSTCTVSTLSNDPYSGSEGDDLGTYTGVPSGTPMFFTGYANQQLP